RVHDGDVAGAAERDRRPRTSTTQPTEPSGCLCHRSPFSARRDAGVRAPRRGSGTRIACRRGVTRSGSASPQPVMSRTVSLLLRFSLIVVAGVCAIGLIGAQLIPQIGEMRHAASFESASNIALPQLPEG